MYRDNLIRALTEIFTETNNLSIKQCVSIIFSILLLIMTEKIKKSVLQPRLEVDITVVIILT